MSFPEMVDTNNSNAYLCHHCYNKAKRYEDLIDQVREIAGGLLSMASKLTALPSAVPSRRKRPAFARDDPVVPTTVHSRDLESIGKLTRAL